MEPNGANDVLESFRWFLEDSFDLMLFSTDFFSGCRDFFSSHGGGKFLRPGDPMGWLCGASKLCPDGRQGPGVV